jgi:hypothetical protein
VHPRGMVVHDRTRLIGQLPFFTPLFLSSLFLGLMGGAHVRVESLELIKVDSPMPPEYSTGINPFSPL